MRPVPRAFDPEQLTMVCRGDRELERFVLGKFLTEAPQYLRAMKQAAEIGDFDELLSRSHAFRDASQVVGAYELARACLRFEMFHDRLGTEMALDLLTEVTARYEAVASQITTFLSGRAA